MAPSRPHLAKDPKVTVKIANLEGSKHAKKGKRVPIDINLGSKHGGVKTVHVTKGDDPKQIVAQFTALNGKKLTMEHYRHQQG